jgi:hypothetical protein
MGEDEITWDRASAQKHLLENWNNPKSPIAFLGITKLFNFYSGTLKKDSIEKLLWSFESYSLQREEPHSKKQRFDGFSLPTHLYNCIEVDSFDISELADDNLSFKHIFCAINTFSKRLFAVPLKHRDAKGGMEALEIIFTICSQLPDFLVSDEVREKTTTKTI